MLKNINEENRQAWLAVQLQEIPRGSRILDAGAGELKNRKYCEHLDYTSQDFCQYTGGGNQKWDTSRIEIVSDITSIPVENSSFDAILCSEVLEHVPEPTHALDEFVRILRSGGSLIVTAPFSSNSHQEPFHFCTGFSRFWYMHHLPMRGLTITQLTANGDWYKLLAQEVSRLGPMERSRGKRMWPAAYGFSRLMLAYMRVLGKRRAEDYACFGYNCIAIKD